GGMTTGGGGGMTTGGGGGTTGGGGGSTGPDAGCPAFLCPELDWMNTGRSSIFPTVAPGHKAETLSRFTVVCTFEANAAGSNNFTHFEYRFTDAGVNTINRTSAFDNRTETTSLRGLSLTDFFVSYRTYVTRIEGSLLTDFSACQGVDGGMTDPYQYAVFPVTADEAWFVGYPASICHWTRAGGLVATVPEDPNSKVYYLDVYRKPSGEVYVVGGNYDSSSSTATGVIVREDGSYVSADPVVDTWYDEAYASIDGVGDDVYVLARSNAQQRGEIHKLQADGGFGKVFTANFRLAKLDVTPAGEVWAVGENSALVIYFDGGTWAEHPLVQTEFRSDVRWENVQAVDEGIVLSGLERQEDGGRTAVVNTYRRFGK
ncbi:MAG TPA: hypothetical protein VGE37_00575, partial [Archangium sp.]